MTDTNTIETTSHNAGKSSKSNSKHNSQAITIAVVSSLPLFVIVFVIIFYKIYQNKRFIIKSYLKPRMDRNNVNGRRSDNSNDFKQPLIEDNNNNDDDNDNDHDDEKLENIELQISNGYMIAGDKRIPLELLHKAEIRLSQT